MRIAGFVIYAGCIIVNGVIGVAGPNSAGNVSAKFNLWVTPPGYTFSVWGFIYTFVGIASLYAAISNKWSVKTWIIFTAVNFINALWVGIFSVATIAAMIVCLVIIIGLPAGLLLMWYSMYLPGDGDWKYHLMRNAIAFYLGWTIAATYLNLGIVVVYAGDAPQKNYLIAFWILVPLTAISVTILNIYKQGMNGFKSCVCAWLTVLWGLAGALVTTLSYKQYL